MRLVELFESAANTVVVIYPGRFQLPHKGHKTVFETLRAHFGNNVFISTSDKTEPPKSPFSFAEKKQLLTFAGIPAAKIKQSSSPYVSKEIVEKFDPATTIVLFAVGAKDMEDNPRFQFGPKKDGSPAFFQPFKSIEECDVVKNHGYIITAPTVEFTVLGEPMTSASELRKKYSEANAATRKKIIKDLYGDFDQSVFDVINTGLRR